jgi:hypothetical protein
MSAVKRSPVLMKKNRWSHGRRFVSRKIKFVGSWFFGLLVLRDQLVRCQSYQNSVYWGVLRQGGKEVGGGGALLMSLGAFLF